MSKELTVGAKVGIVLAGLFALALVIGGTLFASYVSATNEGARFENQIVLLNQDSENKLSTYTVKIQEMIQVPEMYQNDLKEVIKATFEGRYGSGGSKAVMQWIQENNLQFDSKLFVNLQTVIEAGRDEFRIAQTLKLQECRNYRTNLDYFWKGYWLKFAGFPKKNLDTLCQVISDSRTQEIFNSGVQSPISLRAQ
ncbi:major capsid protein [Pectobacterium phage DU_PP_V]|uniref:Major capsid protein n=1 Tax=Pectobacterium phage DU_PP_V TaxID=2041492 RepID=A0A2D2W753_9CAUD|nr:virion structural protein [Pectobacterium phage DU_PP_V]ATS94044.1 major capsid protein [Pectobacterium phage DU_PP_V]